MPKHISQLFTEVDGITYPPIVIEMGRLKELTTNNIDEKNQKINKLLKARNRQIDGLEFNI
jgi:hypothetical protein